MCLVAGNVRKRSWNKKKDEKKKKKNRDGYGNMVLHIEEVIGRVRKKNCYVSSRMLCVVVTQFVTNMAFWNNVLLSHFMIK